MQQARSLELSLEKQFHLDYLLYLPRDVQMNSANSSKKWPLIIFLHGAGERGTDLDLIKKHGIPKIVEGVQDFPFITVSPQCPPNRWWPGELDSLDLLFEEILDLYPVDPNRVYLTGLSMGGFGTWDWAVRNPKRFAAIAPICGGGPWYTGFPGRVVDLKAVPVWVFHGAKDPVVPLRESEILVEELLGAGGNVQFTVYPEANHDSWTETYSNPELYEWFLANFGNA